MSSLSLYSSDELMLQFGYTLAKRFAVLIPGIIIAVFSVHNVFPFLDKRIPDSLAVFVTYILGAYVLIPALIRLVRIVRPINHLPLYCVTPDGFASDPVNIGIIGTRMQLIQPWRLPAGTSPIRTHRAIC